jgi:uncharacterized protein YhaN
MAIKQFDDIDKKARELEAQAKKLRREKQAAKTKAYADALVTVFPEVKDMGSPDEILAFVQTLRKSAGHANDEMHTDGAQTAVVREPVNAAESSDSYHGSNGAEGVASMHHPFD